MSSNEISFEEKQTIVQDNLISLISGTVHSPIVRFLKPEERTMSEKEMISNFNIYNGFVYITHYSKKSRPTNIQIEIGKDFGNAIIKLDLSPNAVCGLKAWIRCATLTLERHFTNHYDGVYIGRLRFDFITKDGKEFFVPNLLLYTNVFLYRDIITANSSHFKNSPEDDPNRISVEDFVNSEWSDILIERDFRTQVNNTQS